MALGPSCRHGLDHDVATNVQDQDECRLLDQFIAGEITSPTSEWLGVTASGLACLLFLSVAIYGFVQVDAKEGAADWLTRAFTDVESRVRAMRIAATLSIVVSIFCAAFVLVFIGLLLAKLQVRRVARFLASPEGTRHLMAVKNVKESQGARDGA